MTQQQIVPIPLDKLVAWEGNVRKTESDKGIDELAASIKAHGLLQSPVVRKDKGDKYAVVAGRRRLRALQLLAKQKHIPADHMVNCQPVNDEADATEISLVENVQREQMHPADEFEAFKALIDGGMLPADIAARFGVTETVVQKRLKLANVSPKLIALYRKGEMTLQHVMAFTVTDDHKAQERVWEGAQQYREVDADTIRDTLTEDEIRGDDRRVQFVTLEAYEKAGGAVRRDLFSDGDDGAFIMDGILLAGLVSKKLQEIAENERQKGWKWVEWREHFDYSEWSKCKRVHPDYDDSDDEDSQEVWKPEVLAVAGAIVSIGRDGEAEIHHGFIKPEDMPAAKGKKKDAEKGKTANKGNGLSASLVEDLSIQRTAALGTALASNAGVALAATVHALALDLYEAYNHPTCLQVRLNRPYLRATKDSAADKALDAIGKEWKKKLPKKPEALWDWCFEQDNKTLLSLLAFCVAHSVNAVMGKHDSPDSTRFGYAAKLAEAVKMDMADYFTPTAENYFSRVTRAGVLEDLKNAKGKINPAWEKAKKGELDAIAEREIKGTKWLPEMLRAPAEKEPAKRRRAA